LSEIKRKTVKEFNFNKGEAVIKFDDNSYILITYDMYDGLEYMYEGKETEGLIIYIDINE
jgi:hypothetical protein